MRIQLFLRRLAEIADFYTTPMPTSEEEPRPKVNNSGYGVCVGRFKMVDAFIYFWQPPKRIGERPVIFTGLIVT